MTERRRGRRAQCIPLLLLATCLFARPVLATETDQYAAWEHTLEDSTAILNTFVNQGIQQVLDKVNQSPERDRLDCDAIANKIMWKFTWFGIQRIEHWTEVNDQIDAYPPVVTDPVTYWQRYALFPHRYVLSRARTPFDWLIPMSRTVRLNGIYIGTDKMSHFVKQGWQYHVRYRKTYDQILQAELRKGVKPEVARARADQGATERVLLFGVGQENGSLGASATGVFSYGDMEANFQGMRFFNGLCRGGQPQLKHTARGWVLTRPFDWRDYVTPLWDESYNVSYYSKQRWTTSRSHVTEHCAQLSAPWVRALRQDYARRMRDVHSPSHEFVLERIQQGRLPDPSPFRLEYLCPVIPHT